MAAQQDRFDQSTAETRQTGPRSWTTLSDRPGERIQVMADGTDLSFLERLQYALSLVPRREWQNRIGRSAKQIDRYVNGADVPFSVVTMISVGSGVPIDWLASGRPTYGQSEWDRWRENLAPESAASLPASLRVRSPAEMAQVSETAHKLDAQELQTIESADFRVEREKPEVEEASAVPSNLVLIKRYDVRASAGTGAVVDQEELIGMVAFDEMFLRRQVGVRSDALVTVEATGDSMEPTIRDGDILLVDTSENDIRDGRIYVINVHGLLSVKRIRVNMDGSLAVCSDNTRYDIQTIRPSERDPLRVIGRVVYQAGPVRS